MRTVNFLDHLLEVENELNESMNLPLKEPDAFISWQGIKMISEGSLISIQGKSGSHKSRLAAEIATVLLSPKSNIPSKLGMLKLVEEPVTVAILDTELSSSFELPKALKNISQGAGISTPNNCFRITSLRDLQRNERRTAAGQFIEEVRARCEGKLCVIVDVVTDITADFNNVSETGEVLDLLKTWLNVYKCAIIAVIHENPGSEKMRGHLGTEILNKASDSISIKLDKKDNLIEIKFEKCRSYKRPDKLDVEFNETSGRMELLNRMRSLIKAGQIQIAFEDVLIELFRIRRTYTRPEIIKYASQKLYRKEDSIDIYLDAVKSLNIEGIVFELVKGKKGKFAIYELRQVQDIKAVQAK